jgi:O-acetyl-ADP-ribose deacetylase (regulator of RNase III)
MESTVAAPPEVVAHQTTIRLVRGDITELDVDGFVFYAQPDLSLGSGFGGAIGVRGGAAIQKELKELAEDGPRPTGAVVVSGGGKLKAGNIIHAVGPRFREADTEAKLLETMRNCLAAAEEQGMETLAFPLMGSGYYGIPPGVSARVMLEAIGEHLAGETGLREILICVFDTPQFNAVQAAMSALSG